MSEKEHKEYFKKWGELNARDKVVVLMVIIASGGSVMVLAGHLIIGLVVGYSACGIIIALALLNWRDIEGRRRK